MCGRYATTADPGRLAVELDAIDETGAASRDAFVNYNVAPTNQVLTVVDRRDHADACGDRERRIRAMRWGLIPVWTKAAEPGVPVKGKPLFNARADRAATAPAFRDAVKYRRCLVPMDGWYEWVVEPALAPGTKGKVTKQPYYMAAADGSRLYMAGLWSVWRDRAAPESGSLLSCTIVTTDALGEPARIHNRMPLPLPREHWDAWLDPDHPAPASLLAAPAAEIIAGIVPRPVPVLVNSVRNKGPELLARVEEREEAEQLPLL
ncbi:SOS response-associated peptidase [Nocardia sp. 004]|uniref:SOS response-associated peptidase n=1 Tax=Nocardia sp. 004 TaxID=3385978 RepID=UPI0039A28C70